MNRRLLVTATGLALGLLMAAPGFASAPPGGPDVRRVQLTIASRGETRTIVFDVVADSDDAARAAAESQLAVIAPGATLVESPAASVLAQWRPWPWKWERSEIPVTVAYNPTGAPPGVGPGVITAGLVAWSSVDTSSFRFTYGGITENTATVGEFGPDGENVISWQSLDCSQSCVLGVTAKGTAHEADMLLNSNPAAADLLGVGTKVDWRTVILHELGHMAGLEHSCPVPFGPCTPAEADAVMFYQYRGILRTLAPDDAAGISALYPAGGSPVETPSPYPEYPISLEAGWNLVAPPNLTIAALTTGLPCVSAVYLYEGGEWLSWIRGAPPGIQELVSVGSGRSYWMLAATACGKDFP